MRTTTDIVRSLSTYLFSSLGEPWEMAFADEEGTFRRPYCRVQSATALEVRVANMVQAECRQTFAAVAYPEEKATAEASRMEAERVAELLFQAFAVGTRASAYGRLQNSGVADLSYRRAHPLRVPLWDYDGITLDQAAGDADRDPRDFARIMDPPTIQVLEGTARTDEEEEVYVVTSQVRLSWMRSVAVTEVGVPVQDVVVAPEPPE